MRKITINDVSKYNPQYYGDGYLGWKLINKKIGEKGHRKKKIYPEISIDKIVIPKSVTIDEEVLELSREQYMQSNEMIPVYLTYDFRLIAGYEQYVLAKEQRMSVIPFQKKELSKCEKRKISSSSSDTKTGNKKYCLVTVDGMNEFVTTLQRKRYGEVRSQLRRIGLRLEYVGNGKLRIVDKEGNCLANKNLKSALRFLDGHIYEDGKFKIKVNKPNVKPQSSGLRNEDIQVGNTYFVPSKYDHTASFPVRIVETIDAKTALAQAVFKNKKFKNENKPFRIAISSLYKSQKKAVGCHKQHH